MDAPIQPNNDDNKWLRWLLVAVVIFIFLFGSAALGSSLNSTANFRGENLLYGGTTGGSAVSCAGVASVPAQYMPWVKDAAQKWLGGDEAALIAMIQIESSWEKMAANPSSRAAGLGQFMPSTARGMPEFKGGNDGQGRVWPSGGKITDTLPASDPADIRFSPEPAIYAVAHYMNDGKFPKSRSLGEMYEFHYHGGGNGGPDLQAAAKAGRIKLEEAYAKLRNESCTEVSTSGVAANGLYAPPLDPDILRKFLPLKEHHHGSVAVDIGVPVGTSLYAIASGQVAWVERNTAVIPYRGVSGAGISGACGTGIGLRGEDGITYVYCHMSNLSGSVRKGTTFTAGDFIGLSGNTGYTSGPHVHIGAKGGLTAAELRERITNTVE